MTIQTRDALINALGNNSSRIIIDKASLNNQTAGRFVSLWRATGIPGQGAIPTTAAVCTKALTGAVAFQNQTPPATSYIAWLTLASGNNAMTAELHDRIAHIGGFVLNSTASQTVTGFDLNTLAPDAARVGSTDLSDLQWWLEVYTDGGATSSNATINVTYNDASTGNLTTQAVGSTIRVGNLFSLNALIPPADNGKYIRGVNSVQLSASTGTAGNFGFTVTRPRATLVMPIANFSNTADWAALGLSEVPNDSCIVPIVLPTTSSSGTLRGNGKIAHG